MARRRPQKAAPPRSVVDAVVVVVAVVLLVELVQRAHQATRRLQTAKSQPLVLLSPLVRAQLKVRMAMVPHDRSDAAAAVVVVARGVGVV